MAQTSKTSTSPYEGQPGQTRQETIHYSCDQCDYLFGGQVYRSINVASDPAVGELLERGELNILVCPACDARFTPGVPLIYHHPEARCFALLLPETMRHQELQERANLLDSLAADPADVPHYVKQLEVVFGTPGLLRLLDSELEVLTPDWEKEQQLSELAQVQDQRHSDLEHREAEMVVREEDLQAKQEDLITRRSKLDKDKDDLARGWAELDREREALRSLSVELEAKERDLRERANAIGRPERTAELAPLEESADDAGQVDDEQPTQLVSSLVLEGRPQQDVDRWRASDESAEILFHDDKVFLLAKPGAVQYERFLSAEPVSMIQLYCFAGGPLITLAVLPAVDQDQAVGAEDYLFWCINPGSLSGREVLNKLAEDFTVHLDLFDDESRPVATWTLQTPLAENVSHLLHRADVQLENMSPEDRDFNSAVEAYWAMGEDRLGRKKHNFSSESYQTLPSPAAARLALGIVSYWSEPDNQDYLLLVKSFPVSYWREIRLRVVKRALDFGLALSPPLTDFALEQRLAGTHEELLRTAVSSFAEVSLRLKPSDLDPAQEWENWKLLLADCAVEGVQIDPEIEDLAAAAAKRVGPTEEEAEAAGDLSLLTDDELLPLLTDREQRRDAALELCERSDDKFLEPVYNAVCNMTRAEVARVLPSLLQFGDPGTKLMIQGLRHRKSFVRQGCALALGSLKTEDALEQLLDMLLSEPTNVWREAARALGDMGTPAIGALIAGVKSGDGEGRERIAWALAQVALSDDGNAEVEAMGRGKNTQLARVATRAMEVFVQVQSHDDEVRGLRPLAEATIVRSFTRRFYEALAGAASELREEDILEESLDVEPAEVAEVVEELAEELDDADILEEEVDIQEEDILDEAPGAVTEDSNI